MEIKEVLQTILDNAGNKGYCVEASVDTKDGKIDRISVYFSAVKKQEENTVIAKESYDKDRSGKIEIRETDSTVTETKSKADKIKGKLKIMGA